jgi:hypothetical protein
LQQQSWRRDRLEAQDLLLVNIFIFGLQWLR